MNWEFDGLEIKRVFTRYKGKKVDKCLASSKFQVTDYIIDRKDGVVDVLNIELKGVLQLDIHQGDQVYEIELVSSSHRIDPEQNVIIGLVEDYYLKEVNDCALETRIWEAQ